MKELNLDYEGGKGKGGIGKMVTRRKTESVKSINCTASQTHGLKLRKIRTKQQIEEEGVYKPREEASGNGTWYTKDADDYSITSEVTFKQRGHQTPNSFT